MKVKQWLPGVIGIGAFALIMVAAREHITRRLVEQKYHEAVEFHRALELKVSQVLATHETMETELEQERQRSRDLSDALSETRGELEQTVARLTEENQTVRKLQVRLTAMQQQMDQLQGELAMTLQERQSQESAGGRQVELERIVVSDAALSGFQGRVVSVHRDWGFIVINLGWDAVRIGDTVSIFHDEQLKAKARIDRVQEGMCAATVLPDWETEAVHIDDAVRVL